MQDHYIERDIFPQLAKHLSKKEITLVTGARQTGKTVLLQQLKAWLIKHKHVPPANILFFNLDIMKDWEEVQNQTYFIEYLKQMAQKGKLYVFVDEAQKIPDCSRYFKGIFDSDLNLKLILSGSSSFELKSKLKESLAGRKRVFQVHSFSFREYLRVHDKALIKHLEPKKPGSHLIRNKLIKHFLEYIIWGGYPRVVLSKSTEDKIAVLSEIYTSYIEKDIVGLLDIKNKLGFSNLFRLLMGQTGQLVNVAELSNSLNLDRDTIERYMVTLEETYVIKSLPPFFKNRRQEIIKQKKVYALDLGLRNYALENFHPLKTRQDAGQLFENACFKEILLSLDPLERLRFWRTKVGAEVDFVIAKANDLIPIECKTSLKKPAITLGLRSFIEKFAPAKALVANSTISGSELTVNGAKVEFVLPFEIKKNLG